MEMMSYYASLIGEYYWTQWCVCFAGSVLMFVQAAWNDPEEFLKDSGFAFFIFTLGSALCAFFAPIIVAVFIFMMFSSNPSTKQAVDEFWNLQYRFWHKFLVNDYVITFLPVLCVLTVFLLT